jgi:gliding motility-associated protein GldM
MSGGKETPRQKMIGMMYLVLTALLALNVSKQILDAFVAIEENSQNAAFRSVGIGDGGISDMKSARDEKTDAAARKKVEDLIKIADQVDLLTGKEIAKIDKIKLDLLEYAKEDITLDKSRNEDKIVWSKTEKCTPAKLNLMAVQSKDEYDKPMEKMIGAGAEMTKPDPKSWGMVMFNDISKYRCSLVDMVGTWSTGEKKFLMKTTAINNYKDNKGLTTQLEKMFASQKQANPDEIDDLKKIYSGLTLQERQKAGETENAHWVGKTFDHSPIVAALASLTSLEQSILSARADAIGILKSRAGAGEYSFNKVMPLAYGPSSVNAGEAFEVKVMMAAYDTDNNPIVTGAASVNDGVAIVKGSGSGSAVTVSGNISIKKKDGSTKTAPWTTTIRVMKPEGNVSLPEMNMLYRGYDNVMVGVASGYESTSIVPGANISSLSKSGTGYVCKPGAAKLASVKLMGKSGDKSGALGTFEFRVSALPPAQVSFAGYTNGDSAPLSNIKAGTKLFVGYPPEIPLKVNFTPTSWTLTVPGAPRPVQGTGSVLSDAARNLLKQCPKGGSISFVVSYSGGGSSRKGGCAIGVQ